MPGLAGGQESQPLGFTTLHSRHRLRKSSQLPAVCLSNCLALPLALATKTVWSTSREHSSKPKWHRSASIGLIELGFRAWQTLKASHCAHTHAPSISVPSKTSSSPSRSSLAMMTSYRIPFSSDAIWHRPASYIFSLLISEAKPSG